MAPEDGRDTGTTEFSQFLRADCSRSWAIGGHGHGHGSRMRHRSQALRRSRALRRRPPGRSRALRRRRQRRPSFPRDGRPSRTRRPGPSTMQTSKRGCVALGGQRACLRRRRSPAPAQVARPPRLLPQLEGEEWPGTRSPAALPVDVPAASSAQPNACTLQSCRGDGMAARAWGACLPRPNPSLQEPRRAAHPGVPRRWAQASS